MESNGETTFILVKSGKVKEKKMEKRAVKLEVIAGINPKKFASLKIYYNMVKRGARPGQARNDCELSLEEIEQFDFSVF